jgi:hypothetical protein
MRCELPGVSKTLMALDNLSSVKNSQVVDLESGISALGQLSLPGIGRAEGDSLQI